MTDDAFRLRTGQWEFSSCQAYTLNGMITVMLMIEKLVKVAGIGGSRRAMAVRTVELEENALNMVEEDKCKYFY